MRATPLSLTSSLLLSTTLLGCSAQDAASEQDTGTKTKTAELAHIPIGFITTDLAQANSQQRVEQLLLVLRDINESGGIELADGAHELDLVAVDHGGSLEGVVQAMDKLAESGVAATIGPPWSSLTLGAEPDHSDGAVAAAKRLDMLLISGSATSPAIRDLKDDDLMWRTAPSDDVQGAVAAEYMLEKGHATAAVLHRDDSWGNGLADVFGREFTAGGGTLVARKKLPTATGGDAVDYTKVLTSTFAERPDAVYIVAFEEAFDLALQIDSGGYLDAYGKSAPLFFGADGFFGEDLLTNAPASFLSRVVMSVGGSDPDTESYRTLHKLLVKAGYSPDADLETARIDALALIALAMQAAQSTAAHQIKEVLADVSRADEGDVRINFGQWQRARSALLRGDNIDYEGVTGAIDFDDQGDRTKGNVLLWDIKPKNDGSFEFVLSSLASYDLASH